MTEKNELNETGLAWPKSWKGAYLATLGSMVIWLALLFALTEYGG